MHSSFQHGSVCVTNSTVVHHVSWTFQKSVALLICKHHLQFSFKFTLVVQGQYCDSDLMSNAAEISFSSVAVSAANVSFNGYRMAQNWIGDENTAGSVACCWKPSASTTNEWIMADLGEVKTITGSDTQGGKNGMWVTSYKLSYSINGREFKTYKNRATGNDKVFEVNHNEDGVFYTKLNPRINARFIKLHPQSWSTDIGLRWRLRGCSSNHHFQ